MTDRDDSRLRLPTQREQTQELRKLAYLYHAAGNYAKAEEIMEVVRRMERRLERSLRRQDAA